MNASKVLFKSLINEVTSKIYNWFKGEFRACTHIGNQECWNKFANRCKTVQYLQANN